MVLHLLVYFLDVCDVTKKFKWKSDMRALGSDREACRETDTFSARNDVDENIEFRNVFPKSCLVEIEYLNKNDNPRCFTLL